MKFQSLGWEDPLEEGMATHSVFLPGESHGQRSLAGYNLLGCRVEHNGSDLACTCVYVYNCHFAIWQRLAHCKSTIVKKKFFFNSTGLKNWLVPKLVLFLTFQQHVPRHREVKGQRDPEVLPSGSLECHGSWTKIY